VTPDPRLVEFVYRAKLADAGTPIRWTPLTGGVSSDIWRVDLPERTLCIKCALPKLRVAQDWQAPITRNRYEWAWISFVAKLMPHAVPVPLAHDAQAGILAMSFLPPGEYPLWKAQLMQGVVAGETVRSVAEMLACIHAASAGRADVAAAFPTTDIFRSIRLDPYLAATATRHPDLAPQLHALAERTAAGRIALVHGDVSPKNILVGREGPVFLDAECAWYGDPAFDVAFCLNHFLLKCLARRDAAPAFLDAFRLFAGTYLGAVTWEPAGEIEARSASLLPGLFLARVDGKSPVEYITRESDRDLVRGTARLLLREPPRWLGEVVRAWEDTLRSDG
jgi:aminoglycoside phosphotransferase (APT) family kinase protein